MISGKTDSGLQYAVRRSGTAAAYCALSIKCGTRDEAGYSAGLAHFVEHTLFKGTAGKSAKTINGYLDRLGGELNAYTTKEEIVLHATVLKEDLNKAMNLLLELAATPTFPQSEIETEKSVIIDEIKSYKDAPSEEIYDRFEELLFAGHPLSIPILGTIASVKKITASEIHRFVREKFVPGKMALTVVADMDEAVLERAIRRLSEKWFPKSAWAGTPAEAASWQADALLQAPTPIITPSPAAAKFEKVVNKKNYQANCIIGHTAPSLYEDGPRVAAILLCNILGGPANNSILNAELREKRGWVYGVECTYTQYSDTGIAAISLGCDKENVHECVAATLHQVRKLQESPMSEARLKAAKRQIFGQMAIGSDSGEAQCLSMGKSLLAYGRVIPESTAKEKIEALTASDIMYAARNIFDESTLSTLIFL